MKVTTLPPSTWAVSIHDDNTCVVGNIEYVIELDVRETTIMEMLAFKRDTFALICWLCKDTDLPLPAAVNAVKEIIRMVTLYRTRPY